MKVNLLIILFREICSVEDEKYSIINMRNYYTVANSVKSIVNPYLLSSEFSLESDDVTSVFLCLFSFFFFFSFFLPDLGAGLSDL